MAVQAETEFIEVKSPIDRFKEEWERLPGRTPLFRQRKFILQTPELVQYVELARPKGWIQPLTFALMSLFLVAFVLSALNWLVTHDRGKQADEIVQVRAELESQLKTDQAVVDASEFELRRIERSRNFSGFTVASATNLTKSEAEEQLNALIEEARKLQEESRLRSEIKIQNLRAAEDAFALVTSGTSVIFSLALVFAAPVFRRTMQRQYHERKLVRQADGYYLYIIASRGLWANFAIVLAANVFLSAKAYGLQGFVEGMGPIGVILFCLALYALLVYWAFIASKDLHNAMQIPKLGENVLHRNKIMLSVHNGFICTFILLEATLGMLSYVVYLVEKT